MAGVHNDIALITAAVLACDSYEDDEPAAKKKRSPSVCERPWLAHRADPTCENVYTLMLKLREVSTCFYNNNIVCGYSYIYVETLYMSTILDKCIKFSMHEVFHDIINMY